MRVAPILLGLLLACSAHAQPAAPLAPAFAAVCDAHPGVWPAEQSLASLNERLRLAQPKGDPFALEGACQGLRRLAADPSAGTLDVLQYQAHVAAALFWLRRSPEAQPLFQELVSAYRRAARPVMAAQNASMLALIHFQRGETDVALRWSQAAFDDAGLPEQGVAESDRFALRLNHALLLSNARRYPEAESALSTLATEAAQRNASPLQRATLHGNRSVLKRRQGQLTEALAEIDAEIALRRVAWPDDGFNLVSALSNRGLVLQELAQWGDSEAALREGVATADRAEGVAVDLVGHAVTVREQLSTLLLARGDVAGALAAAQQAVDLMGKRPERDSARGARPWRRLGDAQLAHGALAEGLASYQQALQRLGPGKTDGDSLPLTRLSLARAWLELGNTDDAAEQLRLLDADPRPATPDEVAHRQTLLAALALRQGGVSATAEALKAWLAADSALAKSRPASHPQRQVLAALRCEWGDADACALLETANLNPEALATVWLAQARKALRHKDAGSAKPASHAAQAALLAATNAGQPRLQWQALALLGQAYQQSGHAAQAILLGKMAIELLQAQREQLLPLGRTADTRYLADKAFVYRWLADTLLQAGRLPEARQVLDLLKAHEQVEYLVRAAAPLASGELGYTPGESQAREAIERWINGVATAELKRLRQLEAAGRLTPAEREQLRALGPGPIANPEARSQELTQLLARLQARPSPQAAGGVLAKPGPGVLHVHTLAGDDALSLLLIDAKGSRHQRLPWRLESLGPAIAQWRDAVQRQLPVEPAAAALRDQLGAALDRAAVAAGARRVVLSLDGPLRYLPPALLVGSNGQLLVHRYELLIRSPGQAASGPHTRLAPWASAFGVTRALQGLPALPSVSDELCGIVNGQVNGLEDPAQACAGQGRGPLPGQALLNEAFTEAQLVAASQQRSQHLLHLGTHFVLRPGNISRSWLLLGDGQRLQLDRLRQLPLGAPSLVTLSACETAVGGTADGREVDGLASAMLDLGARKVLASLWRLDDAGTARFMRRFYAALAARQGQAAQALRLAQAESQRAGEPARIWAAFVLMARSGP